MFDLFGLDKAERELDESFDRLEAKIDRMNADKHEMLDALHALFRATYQLTNAYVPGDGSVVGQAAKVLEKHNRYYK